MEYGISGRDENRKGEYNRKGVGGITGRNEQNKSDPKIAFAGSKAGTISCPFSQPLPAS